MATGNSDSEPGADDKPVRGRPFKKGESGNPSGRPKAIKEFQRELREKHYDKAMKALGDCLDDPDGKTRVAALREVFDRLFGKSTAHLAGADGGPIAVAVDISSLLERLAKP